MSHVQIPLFTIKPESIIPFNLFRKEGDNYALVVEDGDIFPKNLSNLILNYPNHEPYVYLHKEDKPKYYAYLENILGKITQDTGIVLKEKSKLIYDFSANTLDSLFQNPESKELMNRSKNLILHTINIIFNHDNAIKSMMEISSHDYYTYTHSVDVALFSMGFANHLNYSYDDISNIGYAALLHDIGKSKIPLEILTKKTPLDFDEFEIIKSHSHHGCEILQLHGEKNTDILNPVRHHHEKALGNGYPDKLPAAKTHEFAKIIAIADIFSALTTTRSYKEAYSSFNALQLMKNDMLHDLDKNLFFEFVKFMTTISRQ